MGLFVTTLNGQKTLTIVIMNSPIVFIIKEAISTKLKVVSTTYYMIIKILLSHKCKSLMHRTQSYALRHNDAKEHDPLLFVLFPDFRKN